MSSIAVLFCILLQTLVEVVRLGKSSTEQVIRRFLCDLVEQQVSYTSSLSLSLSISISLPILFVMVVHSV